jgi:hypothetical protein
MIFVLDTAIGLGIWIPFTIGKSTALLMVRSIPISMCVLPNNLDLCSAGPTATSTDFAPAYPSHQDSNRSNR